MRTLLITYDLRTPGQDYKDVHEYIKGLGTWWHSLESTWLVVTSETPVAVRDGVAAAADSNDKILVIDVSNDPAAWRGLTSIGNKWLQDNL